MTRSCIRANLLAILAILALGLCSAVRAEPPAGVLPLGDDGKPLNLDFETGTLKDWKAEGDAFVGQPMKGDTVHRRRGDMKSEHQGQYWIGTFELHGDRPQGTLTSVAFKATHPWASLLVGGGAHPSTCVELVREDTKAVFARFSGMDEENLRRVVVDLRPVSGKKIFIRLVDRESSGWGHINFDDFRFHAEKPNVPVRPTNQVLQPDVYKYAGLSPEKAAQAMTVPEGFEVKLFAGEPDVFQPIAMCLDDRGRVWVAEAYAYPVRRSEKDAHDRIVIFEDTDGDGKFDKRTVFMEGLNLVSGLEVGFGGVWIGAAPNFMFVPIKEGEDKPAGPPQILLDGWGSEDTHEVLNTFSWGPDGWLYGCHGVFTHSFVGKPGTPRNQRVRLNAGIWRYHPTRHVFEVFAYGTSNPWGFDFNDRGQAFCEACVIPHCFHIIQGARYQRQAGPHFNPYTFDDIKTIADHLHYLGATPHSGNSKSDSAGGGHAHCGTMIYLGGAWPDEYRDQMFMGNIHGHRLNVDILKPKGSGYVAGHGPDFLLANDAWARFINFRYGPDGNVYMIDWYDKQACHTGDVQIWDRTNGRIYKICRRGTPVVHADLGKLSDAELVKLQLDPNDWYVRTARRLLQERGGNAAVHDGLAQIAFANPDETRRLRGLWALHVTNGLTEDRIQQGLADKSEYMRAWTIQLALEHTSASPALLAKMAELARQDSSPVVRLYLASALQRLPLSDRWGILDGLLAHGEDAGDHNLPLMYWYAAEPLAGLDAGRALALASRAKVPPVLTFMVQRIGSEGTPAAVNLLAHALADVSEPAVQRTFLSGISAALKGRRRVAMPADWPRVFAALKRNQDADLRTLAITLAVTFGDGQARAELRELLQSTTSDRGLRQRALASLLQAQDKELAPVLLKLLGDSALRGPAIKGLAAYDDAKAPLAILSIFRDLTLEEKRDALNTLAARVNYGKALLEALAQKKLQPADVPAEIVRQLRNLQNKELDQRIADVWGIVRATPADRARLIASYRQMLRAPVRAETDLPLGRAVFAKACGQCHTLFGVGGKVGPELTGSNRANLDYLLENILDPSAVIPKEYSATVIELRSGRFITGIIRGETPAAVTVVTANETLSIPHDDIQSRAPSATSMMPDDLLKPLQQEEIRSLIAYLQGPVQVPILATAENVKDFFNGKDLTGWDGDPQLWKVENGEIVGRSPGIKRNEFLRSQMAAGDFRLKVKVKLVPNSGNSGVQFRSEALPDGEMRGYQADIGAGWWGKLYEESARGILSAKSGEPYLKPDDWNEYEVVAEGSHIRSFLNSQPCVDLDDPAGARRGIFALQIHSGGPMEVRFKEIRLELIKK